MNLDELQSVQSRERQTDQLQQLRATFYEEAGQFVNQLREERERAAQRAEDPFDSPEVNRLTDDIKTAEQTVEAIYERRVGKIVKMASLAAADMPTEDGGLTQEERGLFESLVGAIEENRGHVLDVIAGEAPTGAVDDSQPAATDPAGDTSRAPGAETEPEPPTPAAEPTDGSVGAADVMGGDPEPSAEEDGSDRPHSEASAVAEADPPTPDQGNAESEPHPDGGTTAVDRRTVRITADVGEIFGVDQREYDLSTDDVVTLPADNAAPLVENDAAEPLD